MRVAGYVANATIIIDGLGTAVGVYGLEAAANVATFVKGLLLLMPSCHVPSHKTKSLFFVSRSQRLCAGFPREGVAPFVRFASKFTPAKRSKVRTDCEISGKWISDMAKPFR